MRDSSSILRSLYFGGAQDLGTCPCWAEQVASVSQDVGVRLCREPYLRAADRCWNCSRLEEFDIDRSGMCFIGLARISVSHDGDLIWRYCNTKFTRFSCTFFFALMTIMINHDQRAVGFLKHTVWSVAQVTWPFMGDFEAKDYVVLFFFDECTVRMENFVFWERTTNTYQNARIKKKNRKHLYAYAAPLSQRRSLFDTEGNFALAATVGLWINRICLKCRVNS